MRQESSEVRSPESPPSHSSSALSVPSAVKPSSPPGAAGPQSAIVTPGAFQEVLTALGDQRVPHLDQYFGLWAIEELRFQAAVNRVQGMDLRAHVAATTIPTRNDERPRADYTLIPDSIAVIELTGPLMKFVGSLAVGTSTVQARRAIRAAVADEQVKAIFLLIDSPGGTVAGTHDLAEDVAWAATRKSLYAYISDLGASAAYWIASAADQIYAGPTALVGAIGTFGVIYDFSAQAATDGVKVHVLRAGAFKGAGTAGTEITAAQLAEWQRVVDELNEHFLAGVARGRRLSLPRVRELADGRIHLAADAGTLGLIDGVRTMDQALEELRAASDRPVKSTTRTSRVSAKEHESMAGQVTSETSAETPVVETAAPPAPRAATLAELKTALPDTNADFREQCLEKAWTLAQAKDARMAQLQAENASQAQELEKVRTQTTISKPGVDPLETGESASGKEFEGGDAVATFDQRVRERMSSGVSRKPAIAAVARQDPVLHEAYLQEVNSGKPQRVKDLITERFAMTK